MGKVQQDDPQAAALTHTAATALGTTGHIEASERRGQQYLVESTQLPTKGSPGSQGSTKETEEAWKATGIEFAPLDAEELFRDAKLPDGWRLEATDHDMWSKLLDGKHRMRAMVFYKAAFYDRRASIDLETRFKIQYEYLDDKGETGRVQVLDCGEVVFSSKEVSAETKDKMNAPGGWVVRAKTHDAGRDECVEWLKAQGFPEYEHPGKYWD